MSKLSLNIGMIGCGTVGQSVLTILRDRKSTLDALGISITVSKIAVRDPSKARSYIPEGATLVGDFNEIINDESINCVVEVMGGTTLAKDAVYAAMKKKKHVITANKALLAEHLPEILGLVADNEVQMLYEAAVCGGIPIIHALQKDFLAEDVTGIVGIMNGTTNFMLSKMETEGADYADVLKEAQDLGFAEANPSADVDGFDVQAKIALLARLGIGTYVESTTVETTGISRITKHDFAYAAHLKATIKLLGIARMSSEGELTIAVAPHVVPRTNAIANISGATNIVNIQSKNLGSSFFIGPGAGGDATANSVVSDIVSLAQGQASIPFPKTIPTKLAADFDSRFYVRFVIKDGVGIIKRIADSCVKHDISIISIEQSSEYQDRTYLPFVVTTDVVAISKMKAFSEEVAKEDFNVEEPFYMPILA